MTLSKAIERVTEALAGAQSWRAASEVLIGSGIVVADLRAIVAAAKRCEELERLHREHAAGLGVRIAPRSGGRKGKATP